MGARSIYIAIMHAAERRHGLRLSADEVVALSLDDAIATRAWVELERKQKVRKAVRAQATAELAEPS